MKILRTLILFFIAFQIGSLHGQRGCDSDFVVIKRITKNIESKKLDLILEEFNYSLLSINNLRDSLGFDYYLLNEERNFCNFSFNFKILMFKDSIISWSLKPFIGGHYNWMGTDPQTPQQVKEEKKRIKQIERSFKENGWINLQQRSINYIQSTYPIYLYKGNIRPGQNKTLDSVMSIHLRFDNSWIFERIAEKLNTDEINYLLHSTDPLLRAEVVHYLLCKKKVLDEKTKVLISIVVDNSPRIRSRHGCVISRQSIVPEMLNCKD